MKSLLLVLTVAFSSVCAQEISTVAGGVPGKGDGGPATSAQLAAAFGLAADQDGNLYVGDNYSYTIRKINISTGIITAVAGNGKPGHSGDGGPALSAQLMSPQMFCVDKNKNIYIAEYSSNTIRKIDAQTALITRFAGTGAAGYSGDGGPATNATFRMSFPGGVAADDNGNLYISDGYNHVIRKVDAAGTITTVAGTGALGADGDNGPPLSAQFNSPAGLVFDAAGDLFVCDLIAGLVRRIDFTNNIVTAVAGAGLSGSISDNIDAKTARLFSPISLVVTSSGDIYLDELDIGRVRKIEAATGLITTVIGGGSDTGENIPPNSASIGSPTGIAPAGDNAIYLAVYKSQIYLADFANNNLSTVAGDRKWPFSGDNGPALNAQLSPHSVAVGKSHELYINDYDNARIRKVDTQTGIITTVAGTGKDGYTGDGGPATDADITPLNGKIITDAAGNFIFADNHNVVRKVDVTTGIIQTVAGNGTAGFSGDGGPATAAQLQYPSGLALDDGGNLFIADEYNHRIRRVDAVTNVITTWAGTGTSGFSGDNEPAVSAQMSYPRNLVFGKNGDLFISEAGNVRIRKIERSTGIITTIAGKGGFDYTGDGGPAVEANVFADGMAIDDAGDLYIAAPNSQKILKITFSTGFISTIAGSGEIGFSGENSPALEAHFYSPTSIAIDGTTLYIADFNTHRIRKITGLPVLSGADPDVVVYNGVSPNGDGKNERFYLENILTESSRINTVTIFNRWEDVVWHGDNYDNSTVYFDGSGTKGEKLPNGIYYYRIDFKSGKKSISGFVSLKR